MIGAAEKECKKQEMEEDRSGAWAMHHHEVNVLAVLLAIVWHQGGRLIDHSRPTFYGKFLQFSLTLSGVIYHSRLVVMMV